MSNLIKNVSFYSIGNILPQAVGFVLLPIYSRYLSPSDYGIVSSMQVVGGILAVFLTLAINNSVYRLYFDYKTEKRRKEYLGTVSISIAIISFVIVFLLFLFRNFVSQIFKGIEFFPYYMYAILTAYFTVFSLIPKIYLQVNKKAGKFVSISLSQFFISTSLILYFVIKEGAGAEGMLKGTMIASIIMLPVYFYITYKTISFTVNRKILKESLSFSLPMIPSLLSAWILNLSDRIFIERYFDLNDVGLYSMGYKIGSLVLVFASAFNLAYGPIFYKLASSENQDLAKKKLKQYNHLFVLVLILVVFLISFFSKEAILLLLDPKYFEAYKIIPIIAFSCLISQTTGLLNLSIYQNKKTLQMMYMILGGAGFNIFMNFVLVPKYGPYGAAAATVLSFCFLFLLQYNYSKKCYFIPFRWKELVGHVTVLVLVFLILDYVLILPVFMALLTKIAICLGVLFFFYKKHMRSFKSFLNR